MTEQTQRRLLTKDEILEWLDRMGVVYARIHYHGADDESFEDGVELYDKAEGSEGFWYGDTIRTLPAEGAYYRYDRSGSSTDEHLAASMYSLLIDTRGGDGWGDSTPGCEGSIDFHVPERRIVLHETFLDWIDNGPKVIKEGNEDG